MKKHEFYYFGGCFIGVIVGFVINIMLNEKGFIRDFNIVLALIFAVFLIIHILIAVKNGVNSEESE